MSQLALFASILGLIILTTVVDGCGRKPNFGLEVRPKGPDIEPGLIWFNSQSTERFKKFTDAITEFLKEYRAPGTVAGRGQNVYHCDYNQLPSAGQLCDIDVKNWGPCVQENLYGYHKSSPCVFLKVNMPDDWQPEFYNASNILPATMPKDLKDRIAYVEAVEKEKLNTVWASCDGMNPVDKENIGPISYFPRAGFAGYYFLNSKTEGYLSPIIAIHLERPQRGIVVNVECKAWARNIQHDADSQIGLVNFDILID